MQYEGSKKRLLGFEELRKKYTDLLETGTMISKKSDKDPTQKTSKIFTNGLMKDLESFRTIFNWFRGLLDKDAEENEEVIKALNGAIDTCLKSVKLVSRLGEESLIAEFSDLLQRIIEGDIRKDLFSIKEAVEIFCDAEVLVLNDNYLEKDWSICEEDAAMLAELFKADRAPDEPLTFFQANPKNLTIFKEFLKVHHDMQSVITGPIEMCKEADTEGATIVAKNGIKHKGMERNTFDVTIVDFHIPLFKSEFHYTVLDWEIQEKIREKLIYGTARKGNGYFVLLLPVWTIPFATKTINMRMEVQATFLLKDEMVAIIGTNSEPDLIEQNRYLKVAHTFPERLMEIEEAEEDDIIEITGEYKFPEIVRAEFLDFEDHVKNLKDFDVEEIVTNHFKVEENIAQLSRPVQEYGLGHIAAVAILGLGDGIQDETVFPEYYNGTVNPHLYTAKMAKLEVEEVIPSVVNDEFVEEIIQKQRAVISIAIRTQDGENQILLDTSGNVTEREEFVKED